MAFEVKTQDTIYNWSTKDTEFENTFYEGIIDPSSFNGINESISDSNGIDNNVIKVVACTYHCE